MDGPRAFNRIDLNRSAALAGLGLAYRPEDLVLAEIAGPARAVARPRRPSRSRLRTTGAD